MSYLTGGILDNEQVGVTPANAPLAGISAVPFAFVSGPAAIRITWPTIQNCLTYDQQMFLLVPQAIRYSAWFMDYFFRGSLTASLAIDGTLTIHNNGTEILNDPTTGQQGSFQLYSDDSLGNRTAALASITTLNRYR
jgi:hypothetical protein